MPEDLKAPSKAQSAETDVYAIHGADPEVLAYAMAKYSRSSLTMKESLVEISSQRAEQFLNTFYFQYGHRSIADLAHIPFAIERLSLLAAIALVDEQRWDGQERSTRYQNFRTSGWFTPDLGAHTADFTAAVEAMFHSYDRVGAGMLEALKTAVPQPESMKDEAYIRTLKAAGLRRRPLPSAARDQHLARPDRERPHAGDAGLASADQSLRRDPPDRREAPHRRDRTGLERPGGRGPRRLPGGRFGRLRVWRTCPQHVAARRQDRANAGQVRHAERLSVHQPRRIGRRRGQS